MRGAVCWANVKLRTVQNNTARLVLRVPKIDHISTSSCFFSIGCPLIHEYSTTCVQDVFKMVPQRRLGVVGVGECVWVWVSVCGGGGGGWGGGIQGFIYGLYYVDMGGGSSHV